MFLMKNGLSRINIFSIQARTKVLKYLKCILTYLYCIKYDEINVYHLCMHKNVFHNV